MYVPRIGKAEHKSTATAGAEKHTSYQKRSGLPHILSSSSSSSSTGKLKKDNSRLCPTALAFHVHCSSPATANVCYVSKGNGLDHYVVRETSARQS